MATQKGRNWSSGDIVTAANLSSVERGISAMAEEYTPTTWSNGDTVTAAALNKIEQGIANSGSSDFNMATLTIIDPNELLELIFVPCVSNGCADFTCIGDPSEGISVILVEGKAWLEVDAAGSITLAGNITAEGRRFLITGDCTITISGSIPEQ